MPRGRLSIFAKDGPKVQGIISVAAGVCFERARRRLAVLAGWRNRTVSDADTIEYLARGEPNTVEYLRRSIMALDDRPGDRKPTPHEKPAPPAGEKVPGTGNTRPGPKK